LTRASAWFEHRRARLVVVLKEPSAMSSSIFVRGRLTPKPGKEAEFDAIVEQFVKEVGEGDPGTLGFGFYRDAEGGYVVMEHYESAETAVGHCANVGHLFAPLGELVGTSEPLQVHGEPNDELRELWKPFGPVYLPTIAAI
jgi:quinol monooxygenase YgiN